MNHCPGDFLRLLQMLPACMWQVLCVPILAYIFYLFCDETVTFWSIALMIISPRDFVNDALVTPIQHRHFLFVCRGCSDHHDHQCYQIHVQSTRFSQLYNKYMLVTGLVF
ncbi:hypothetical protein M758_5G052100 [Ceratodon purpureus]|nr:hypothetical protein M758_5G052100 [Ceratodon purpureus]